MLQSEQTTVEVTEETAVEVTEETLVEVTEETSVEGRGRVEESQKQTVTPIELIGVVIGTCVDLTETEGGISQVA